MKFRKRVKRLIITTGLLVTLGLGSMTAYAAGPGEQVQTQQNQTATQIATQETQTEQSATAIISYAQAQVSALGSWEAQADGNYKFKQFTGSYLTNAWIESLTTQGTWYFLDSTGTMLRSATTPDGFYVDSNGEYKAPLTSNVPNSTTHNSSTSDTTSQQTTTTKHNTEYKNPKKHDQGSPNSYIDHNANQGLELHG